MSTRRIASLLVQTRQDLLVGIGSPGREDASNWTTSRPAALPARGSAVAGLRAARAVRRSLAGAPSPAPGVVPGQERASSSSGRAPAAKASQSCRCCTASLTIGQALDHALVLEG